MNKEYLNNIVQYAELLKKACEDNLSKISKAVNDIIKYKIKDKQIIEHTFDSLLDLLYIIEEDKINFIYYNLLYYYQQIDLDASKDYESFYLEIINEDNQKYSLKK